MKDITLEQIGRFETGVFAEGAAEIVAYDAASAQLFVVNAQARTVDVLDISDPAGPELVGENESLAGNPVVQRAELRFVNQNSAGTAIYSMSNHDANKQMDTFMVRFAKGANMDGLFTSTYGQVFCHVLAGEVRFNLKDKQYLLKQGDSIYFNAKHQHAVQNASDGDSEVIWVQSPPNF